MEKTRLILSTNNSNKVKEIRDILKDLPIEVLSKKELGLARLHVVEDGDSLLENSRLKARELSKHTDHMIMADDSGLFVDILDGQPGVHSSRYGGQESDDRRNNEKLLKELEGRDWEERRASFKAVITIIGPDKEEINISGECRGHIGLQPKGAEGFGYDPLFIPEGYHKSFAQLDRDLKNKISHRARALEEAKQYLSQLIKGGENENSSSK